MVIRVFTILALSVSLIKVKAQINNEIQARFDSLSQRADTYAELYLFEQAMSNWTKAIELAKEQGLTEQYLDARISLAELLRKTGDYERSLNILLNLHETRHHPRLQVRKLGRIAAVYHERGGMPSDTVEYYITKALDLAIDFNFVAHEASLKNELGYFISRNKSVEQGLEFLLEAARIYHTINDTFGYIGAKTHVLEDYYSLGQTENVKLVQQELLSLVKGTSWYSAQVDIYDIIANYARSAGDSLKFYRWKKKAGDAATLNDRAVSSKQMAAFRVLHDTRRYQEEAEISKTKAQLKADELEKQQARTRELTIYLSILGIFILLVVALFVRERRLKAKMDQINQELQVANEKYQMLMVESNHRIKNNLQMVISMLQYTSREMEGTNTIALKRISSKIHTISALHKHLYLDVHNERVRVDTYFDEIIALYEEIATQGFQVIRSIHPVAIKSERIVYFGLIFNEMLSNTLEHQKAKLKSVNIEIVPYEEHFQFNYYDGSNISIDISKGTGSKLIEQLIRRIGGVDFQFNHSKGHYQFNFYG